MSKKDFENLVNNYQQQPEKKVDWEAEKNQWLDYIKQFYSSIESWLKPYADQNKLSFSYTTSHFIEDNIGPYDANVMNINFAGRQVAVKPIGTLLIGTKGRIDMEGPRGRVQFILADKDSKGPKITVRTVMIDDKPLAPQIQERAPNWTWKLVRRDSARITYDDFNENNFFSALMEIANG